MGTKRVQTRYNCFAGTHMHLISVIIWYKNGLHVPHVVKEANCYVRYITQVHVHVHVHSLAVFTKGPTVKRLNVYTLTFSYCFFLSCMFYVLSRHVNVLVHGG